MYSDAKMEMFILREMLLASMREDCRVKLISDEPQLIWQPEMLEAIVDPEVLEYDKFKPAVSRMPVIAPK